MKYSSIVKAKFISRPNRFIAYVEVEGKKEVVHVKNTGRCKELLVSNADVFLSVADNPERKTKYDLIGVEKGSILVNMDSQAPNAAVEEWLRKGKLFSKKALIKREYTYGKSRFDFYVEDGKRKTFIEVKGVTLEKDGVAYFPDAPTERGIKHIQELESSLKEGYEAIILFVIQMKKISEFRPNDETHKAFGDALRKAEKSGVNVLAIDCMITPDSMTIDKPVEVNLGKRE
jgi:sugar fermentation stimulation protein A